PASRGREHNMLSQTALTKTPYGTKLLTAMEQPWQQSILSSTIIKHDFPLSASVGGNGQPRGAAPATLRRARLRWARPSAFARPNRTSVRPLAKSGPHRRALQTHEAWPCREARA